VISVAPHLQFQVDMRSLRLSRDSILHTSRAQKFWGFRILKSPNHKPEYCIPLPHMGHYYLTVTGPITVFGMTIFKYMAVIRINFSGAQVPGLVERLRIQGTRIGLRVVMVPIAYISFHYFRVLSSTSWKACCSVPTLQLITYLSHQENMEFLNHA
jgi:hypothetical protein